MNTLTIMDTSTDASKTNGVFAERNSGIRNSLVARLITATNGFSLVVSTAILLSVPNTIRAATRQDLQKEIDRLLASVTVERSQNVQVINAITVAVAPPQSLTVGTIEAGKGATVDLPIYFKSGKTPVTGLQFDVVFSSNMSISTVSPGIASQAAEKVVQGTNAMDSFRVIIFGLNENELNSGPVAILKITASENPLVRKTITIKSIVGTSAAGSSVPVTGVNGSLTVR